MRRIPPNIKLADPTFNQPSEVDLLIVSPLFWELLCIGRVTGANGISYHKMKLGWVVTGEILIPALTYTKVFLSFTNLHNELKHFWKIDEFISKKTYLTPDEEYCETLFRETTTRTPGGKFMVRIPFKSNIFNLGNSFEAITARFLSLERKF